MLNGRKKIIIILILFFVLVFWLLFKLSFISLSPSSLIVQNIMIDHNSITLNIMNGNSGVWLCKFYQYQVKDRTLFLKLYGTLLPCFELTDNQIHIDKINSADIDFINIVGQQYSLTIWRKAQ